MYVRVYVAMYTHMHMHMLYVLQTKQCLPYLCKAELNVYLPLAWSPVQEVDLTSHTFCILSQQPWISNVWIEVIASTFVF